jgi:hypothetical protein
MTEIIRYPTKLKGVLDILPHLSRKELELVRQRAAFLLQAKTSRGRESVEEQDWLLEGVLHELRKRGLEKQIPHNFRVKSSKSFAAYQTQAERVKGVIAEAIGGATPVELKQVGIIAAQCLADYITWNEISLETMLHNIGKTPKALERAFPGYIASGLLYLILKAS